MGDDYSLNQYFCLAGLSTLYGLDDKFDLHKPRNSSVIRTLTFNAKDQLSLKIRINRDKGEIRIIHFQNHTRRRDIFLIIFKSMVENAVSLERFRVINFSTKGNFKMFEYLNLSDYFDAGRCGFQMVPKCKSNFLKFVSDSKISPIPQDIFELLKTKQGREWWIKKGWSWSGRFYIAGSKDCRPLLETITTLRI